MQLRRRRRRQLVGRAGGGTGGASKQTPPGDSGAAHTWDDWASSWQWMLSRPATACAQSRVVSTGRRMWYAERGAEGLCFRQFAGNCRERVARTYSRKKEIRVSAQSASSGSTEGTLLGIVGEGYEGIVDHARWESVRAGRCRVVVDTVGSDK